MTTKMIADLITAFAELVALGLILAGKWKIMGKMGEKSWKALIPIYSEYLIFKHTWSKKAFWVTLATATVFGVAKALAANATALTPAMAVTGITGIACIVLAIKAAHKLAKAFGHGTGYTVGLILAEPIFAPIIGFGKSEFVEA